MADEPQNDKPDATPAGNPEQAAQPGTDANAPQIASLAQYIKDLSVENPNSPQSFQYKGQPKIDLGFNIDVQKVNDDVYEVALKIEAKSTTEDGVHFIVDLNYGGLFGLKNIPEQQLQPILLVELPRLIFPFARQVVAEATSQAGFAPLLLDPIDFGAVYMQRMQQMQAQAAQEAGQQGDASDGGQQPAPASAPSDDS